MRDRISNGLRRTYDRIASDYALDHASDRWGYGLISEMLTRLPPGSRVLDAGCGFGRECAYVASRGFRVIGIDFSKGMIREARRRFPRIAFHTMRLERLKFAPRSFDAIIARSSLLHIPKAQIPLVLRGLTRVLKPSGWLYIAVKEGSGERWIMETDYGYPYRRFFAFLRRGEVVSLLEQAGIVVRKEARIREGKSIRLHFIAQKRPPSKSAPRKRHTPNSGRVKAIVFDWSGTLLNNQRTMYQAVRQIFRDYGKGLSYKTFAREFRQPLHEFYQEHLPTVTMTTIKKKLIRYYSQMPIPKLFPGTRKQLAILHKRGYKIFIFSSHPRPLLAREISRNKLSALIDGTTSDVRDKKLELKTLIAARRFKRRDVLYVGDMTDDIRAAKKADIEGIAVNWGYHRKRKLLRENPACVLYSVEGIARLPEISRMVP